MIPERGIFRMAEDSAIEIPRSTALKDEPGQKLRRARERLQLRYRDVEEASQQIALRKGNDEFAIGLSRLADIENKGTIPSLYRLYSLCAIYRLDFGTVLGWYGIALGELPSDAARIDLAQTHPVQFEQTDRSVIDLPVNFDHGFDLRKTSYLGRQIYHWGKLPLAMLNSLDLRRHRYAFVGTDDWSMYPILAPGSFLQIDDSKKKIASEGWLTENDRPIFFVEHRDGYRCGWCTQRDGLLVLQPHPASELPAQIFRLPGEAEIVGQVVAVAMRIGLGIRRHTRF